MSEGHSEIPKVDYVVPDKHNNPTQSGKYLQMNKMTFPALDYGTSVRS